MSDHEAKNWSAPRRFVAWTAATIVTLVWGHALAGWFRLATDGAMPPAALLSWLAVGVSTVGALALPRSRAPWIAAIAGLAGVGILEFAQAGSWAAALSLPLVAALATWGAARLGGRLPIELDRMLSARRGVAILWIAMGLMSVAQMGRLSTRMSDWSTNFVLTTENAFWHTHQCLSAYLYAAELSERGEANLYDAAHYPALDRDAAPETSIANMVVEDPYQYPPQFLLVPRMALALTRDFEAIRLGWFAVQFSLFVAVFSWLALWIRGRVGKLALWLLPGALVAFPMLHSFQFGQVHLSVIAMAIAAMLAFETGRRVLGGLLLAGAILAKLFPAILLLPLLLARRFRELAWTGAWGIAITLLALWVLGPAPFTAFVDYQLPRLGNGLAFAFEQAWPELGSLVIADNQGVFGLARKLGVDSGVAAWIGRLYAMMLVAFAVWISARALRASREQMGTLWIALLGLASLASPGAWGDYVPGTAIWLLTLVAIRAVEDRRWLWPLSAVAALQFLLLGTMPIGNWEPFALMLPISAIGVLSMLALFATSAARAGAIAPQRAQQGVRSWSDERQTAVG